MKRIDDRRLKVKVKKIRRGGYPLYPYSILPLLPDCDCVFDSRHGTIGFDVFPFAITTRIDGAKEVYMKVYEETD